MTRTLGVMGGMGPAATFDFCARLTALMPAQRDQDHPRILVDCDPTLPDRNRALAGEGPSPAPRLAAMAAALTAAGAEALAMPCNTAHAFKDAIEAAAPGKLVDMIEATVAEAKALHAARAGLIAANGCVAAGLYQRALPAAGIACVLPAPEAQARLMNLIYRIKAGDVGASARAEMREIATALLAAGADVVIAGCTEAPLVLSQADLDQPIVSSTDALARAVIARLS